MSMTESHQATLQGSISLTRSLIGVSALLGLFACQAIALPDQDNLTWQALRQNAPGYVVMLRHAEAPGTGDPSEFRLDDCSTQRNLSPAGKEQAMRVGQAFRRRQIQIAQVFSSQWCRCLDTARLLKLGPVQPLPALNSFFQNRRTEGQQTATVRQLIVNHRQKPGVLLLVTHQVNITAISGIVPRSGAAVVLKANNQGRVEVVGELPPE